MCPMFCKDDAKVTSEYLEGSTVVSEGASEVPRSVGMISNIGRVRTVDEVSVWRPRVP